MFQIQLHIIKTDFWRSEAEARRRRLGLERTAHWCCPRRHSGGARAGPQQYGTYTQIRVPPKIWSCKALHGVVTQLLIIVRSVCWLAPVVFSFRIGEVFHVKSFVSVVFWSCVLRRLSNVIHNKLLTQKISKEFVDWKTHCPMSFSFINFSKGNNRLN